MAICCGLLLLELRKLKMCWVSEVKLSGHERQNYPALRLP
jgi:hypothetical protein